MLQCRKNTNSNSLLKFQVGVFFSTLSHPHPRGVQETNSFFHFMHRERVNNVFLAYCDCQANSKSPFATLCWGGGVGIWDTQQAKLLIAMMKNEEVL